MTPSEVATALAEYDEYVAAQPGPDFGETLISSGAAHDDSLARLDAAARVARSASAELSAICHRVITEALASPEVWCGPDPTRDPRWEDPRGRTVAQVRADRAGYAERAAVCELATRVHLSERTIRGKADTARILQARCPDTWAAFCEGMIDERNADTVASLAISLPADDPLSWERFDQQAADVAPRLPPGKFRTWARSLRERLHPEHIDDRHARARRDRRTWTRPDLDGMADWGLHGPAAEIQTADQRIDAIARHLHDQDGETRTLAQLRADVALALLNGAGLDGADASLAGKPSVAVTVPVMTLLGKSDQPATLEGYGPIDTDTAKRLAGEASSWIRILTHPITGTILDVDRTVYRVPQALKRWLNIRDKVCTFPGCTRPARQCETDHKIEWQHGGGTSAGNTWRPCDPHHVVKTETLWRPHTDPATGADGWRSPTGRVVDADPPPW